jgi:hypothetical protein
MRKFSYNLYLNQIAEKIFTNQNLCKYLYYDEENPLSQSDIPDTRILLTDQENQKIFFQPFSLKVDDARFSRLVVMLNDLESDEIDYFRKVNIDCLIIVHHDLWNLTTTDYVSCRPLLIWDELDYLFDHKAVAGIGSEKTNYSNLIYYNSNFTGYKVCYKGINLPIQAE